MGKPIGIQCGDVVRILIEPTITSESALSFEDEFLIALAGERDALRAQLSASQAREREAVERAEKAEHRIAIMREGILEARSEGCACDFHLYAMDRDLDTPEALDAYLTLEAKNTKLARENLNLESALAAARKALEEEDRLLLKVRDALVESDTNEAYHLIYVFAQSIAPDPFKPWEGLEARAALNGDSHEQG